jgi:hypothetical protein
MPRLGTATPSTKTKAPNSIIHEHHPRLLVPSPSYRALEAAFPGGKAIFPTDSDFPSTPPDISITITNPINHHRPARLALQMLNTILGFDPQIYSPLGVKWDPVGG